MFTVTGQTQNEQQNKKMMRGFYSSGAENERHREASLIRAQIRARDYWARHHSSLLLNNRFPDDHICFSAFQASQLLIACNSNWHTPYFISYYAGVFYVVDILRSKHYNQRFSILGIYMQCLLPPLDIFGHRRSVHCICLNILAAMNSWKTSDCQKFHFIIVVSRSTLEYNCTTEVNQFSVELNVLKI